MFDVAKLIGTLIVGVGLFAAGLGDLVLRDGHLGVLFDITLATAGAGALGVHVVIGHDGGGTGDSSSTPQG